VAEQVPKNLTCEKSTMVGVNPGELLCASTSHNKENVSPSSFLEIRPLKEMGRFEVFTAVMIVIQVF
jgi:hypothetical protein